MSNVVSVLAIETTTGKGSTFRVVDQDGKRHEFISTSAAVQAALLAAFVTESLVPLVVEEGTYVITRVEAFESARMLPRHLEGRYRVDRLATQRVDGIDHLEVFLVDLRQGTERTFNIVDPLLSQLFATAFAFMGEPPDLEPLPVNATIEGDQLVSARIRRREE
jgi:hypothetical protein